MRLTLAVVALLLAGSAGAADPLYLDVMVETPLATLQQQFPSLRKEGCYRIAAERYLLIEIDKKDQKPWRVLLSADPPCRRPEDVPVALDVRHRSDLIIGSKTLDVLEKMKKRPDASAPPDGASRKFGDMEYFYICRVTEACARHTSVFTRKGVVSAIAEWYSE